jgi:hypothetical protein
MTPEYKTFGFKVVTALEILRAYAGVYAEASFTLAMASQSFSVDPMAIADVEKLGILQAQLEKLLEHCQELPVTAVKIRKVLVWLSSPNLAKAIMSGSALSHNLMEVHDRLVDELSTRLFFELPYEKHKMFGNPTSGWEEIIERWPNVRIDVEEMHKCFALSRYPASVFHSTQAIECGLLYLGEFLSLSDPHSGWTAVSSELNRIVLRTKRDDLSEFEKEHFPFLEQMQGVIISLKNAWRNKISHSQGKLVLLTSEFTADIAEEIIIASRAFMRRLATEMP